MTIDSPKRKLQRSRALSGAVAAKDHASTEARTVSTRVTQSHQLERNERNIVVKGFRMELHSNSKLGGNHCGFNGGDPGGRISELTIAVVER